MDAASQSWEQLTAEVIGCTRCPRLVAWREEVAKTKRRAYQDWDYWGKPVPGFGDRNARVALVGLAPAAHGANRTGRMFTGDGTGGSAGTLMSAMYRAGFANQPTSTHRGDGLELRDAYITGVVRCAPPGNRPKAVELTKCRSYLRRELDLLPFLKVVLCLGRMAFDGYVRLLREADVNVRRVAFEHGACYTFDDLDLPALVASYHPSRQNTQTGRLTTAMLDEVLAQVRAHATY